MLRPLSTLSISSLPIVTDLNRVTVVSRSFVSVFLSSRKHQHNYHCSSFGELPESVYLEEEGGKEDVNEK